MSAELELQHKVGGFRALLQRYEGQIKQALPRHVTPERIIRMAITAVQRQPKLLDCTEQSIILSLLQSSEVGLEPGVRGEAYLVPFWNKRAGRMECQFIPGFKGLVKLMRNTGEVGVIQCDVVRKGDHFYYEKGTNYKLEHRPKEGNQGEITHAYICAKIGGEWQFEVMQNWELDSIKNRTKSRDRDGNITGPWLDDEAEMKKKTVIRRGAKLLPASTELEKAHSYEDDDRAGAEKFSEMLDLGDAEVVQPSIVGQIMSEPVNSTDSFNGDKNTMPTEQLKQGLKAKKTSKPQDSAIEPKNASTEPLNAVSGPTLEEWYKTASKEDRDAFKLEWAVLDPTLKDKVSATVVFESWICEGKIKIEGKEA